MNLIAAAFAVMGIMILSLSATVYIQSVRLDSEKNKYNATVARYDNLVKESKLAAERISLEWESAFGELNENYITRITEYDSTIEQLRKSAQSRSSSILPKSNPDSEVPTGLICFDREELDRVQQESEREIEAGFTEFAKTQVTLACVSSGFRSTINGINNYPN